MMQTIVPLAALGVAAMLAAPGRSPERDAAEVAALDTAYQAAVERNDADAMDRTYVRTPSGWRYVFGQASRALPPVP